MTIFIFRFHRFKKIVLSFFHLSYIFFEFYNVKIVIPFILLTNYSLTYHDQLKNNTCKKNLFKNAKLIFLKKN